MNILRFSLLLGIFMGCAGPVSAQLWKDYTDSARMFLEQKKTAGAILFYTKARKILNKDSAFSDTYIRTCNSIAEVYNTTYQYDSAISFYLEARAIIEKIHGKGNAEYALNSTNLGRIHLRLGHYKQAEFLLKEARETRARVFTKENPGYASSCNNLGSVYSITGEFDKAEPLYLEALHIRERAPGKDHPDYAQSCNNLADLYRNTGRYEKAEPLALLAKQIRGKNPGKESQVYAISCTNLANLYADMGQYEKAEQLYIEAKQVREKVFTKESPQYAESCNILADLYEYVREYDKAELLYLEALQVREKVYSKDHRDYAQTCNNLAIIYCDMEQYERAAVFALEAKEIWGRKLDKDDPAIAINNNILGIVYCGLGKYKKAENYFLQARALLKWKFGTEHPHYFTNSLGLARIYRNTHQTTKANELYIQTFNAQYGQVNKVFQFTSENEKQLFLETITSSGDEYQSFYYKNYAHSKAAEPYTISLLSRNLVLSETRQQRQFIYQSGDSVLTAEYNKWIHLKQQLASMSVQSNEAWKYQLKVLENAADSIEKKLVRSSAVFKKSREKISWEKIQQGLDQSEAAVEFISFRYYNGARRTDSIIYAAIILRKNKPAPQLVPLFEKKQLDSLWGLHAGSGIPSRGAKVLAVSNISHSLYDLVWHPLEKHLNGIKKIYFAPAGDLFKIPFAALPVDSIQFLSNKYRLVQLNSTASITGQRESFINYTDKLQLYGGILYDADSSALANAVSVYEKDGNSRSLPGYRAGGKGFEYLSHTSEEVTEVKRSATKEGFNVTLSLGIDATEESLKALNSKNSPAVLHIATHGFFFPDPQRAKKDSISETIDTNGKFFSQAKNPLFRSGLLFAGANNSWKGKPVTGIEDGILTAYEVADMYLPNTKLVVLSACETALGDIEGSEGVYGLQRAFKMAGVQNLVMSLWEVPDLETSEFMQAFYRNLFGKLSVSDAFFNAQTAMKNKYRNEPNKWAAWILVR